MRFDPIHLPAPRAARLSIARRPVPAALSGACLSLAATALLVTIAASLLVSHGDLGWPVLPLSLILFLPVAAFVVWFLGDHRHTGFGPANVVTTLRGGMAALIGACALEYGASSDAAQGFQWLLVATALVALSLDGVDGWLARRTGLASRFGERLDMEVDAYLILILCAVAFAGGKAGPSVFAIGLMRYGFLVWAVVDPRLAQPLAPSLRRKTVCVLQIVLLCAALLPFVAPPLSGTLVLAALVLLVWSFAVDIRALLVRRA